MSSTPVSLFPDSSERSPQWLTLGEITVLGAIWGASFLFMRVAAPEFGALALVELRLAFGAAVLLPFLWRARALFPRRLWPRLVVIGAINSAVPFVLFAWAAQQAPAGVGAIANAMTVLFAALVGFLFFGERIGTRRTVALLVGFSGVVVLASGKVAGASVGWAVAAGALAAFLYGVGLHLVRSASERLAAGCRGRSHLGNIGTVVAAVRRRLVAERVDQRARLGISRLARRVVYRCGLCRLLPPGGTDWRQPHGDRHLSGAAVRRGPGRGCCWTSP